MSIDETLPGRLARWVTAEPDWDTVYAEELPRVYNFFRYRLGPEADIEDLTSRTFEKAWKARHRYRRDIAGFTTWLLGIARNVAIDHLRARRWHVPIDEAVDMATPAATPEQQLLRDADSARLAELIRTLTDRERELIALKFGGGLTNRAIARATGFSESNVGTIIHRAVESLRARW
jgi:RNA polymerase sigma factor (sigma-70 family)